MRTIVVGYDGTPVAERAIRRAAELARALGARVTVVSVAVPSPVEPLVAPGAFGLLPYYSYRAEEAGAGTRPDEALWSRHRAEVERVLTAAGVSAEFAGVVGEPAERIVELAIEQDAELIVVGTGEPGFLDRLLGGSVSDDVAHRAHCDVLIVHPKDSASAEHDRAQRADGS